LENHKLTPIYVLLGVLFLGLFYLWGQTPKEAGQFITPDVPEPESPRLAPESRPFAPRVKIFEKPENIAFAGEEAPTHLPDVWERFEREIYVNAYWESNTLLMMKRAGKFFPYMEETLRNNGIPEDFKYVALIESGLMNVVSPAGARGFWQFMEGTARDFGLEVSSEVDERYHWEKSTVAACKYLRSAFGRFGNWTSVAASYNMGMAGLTRRKNEQQVPNYYDLHLVEETSRYVFRVLALKEIFENPSKYGFELQQDDLYTIPKLKEVEVANTIPNLAQWAIQQGSNYKELKIYNPWLRSDKLTVRGGKTYIISLPG
jgi:membrane-bound lytic murein transglycosylase D